MITGTNCQGCVFAKISNNVQTGCELNRIDKLGSDKTTTSDGVEHFSLSRFCNAFRPKQWINRLDAKESLNLLETVKEEIKPRVGFLILLDTSKENALLYLEQTLTGIRDQTDSQARYIIVSTDKPEYNEGIYNLLAGMFNKEETFLHVLQLLEVPEDKMFVIDEAFSSALNGWIYVTTSGEQVDRNLLKDLNEHINEKMKKLSVVLPYDGINGLVFQTALFKYLNGNRTKIWDVDNSDSRMFLEKIKDLDKDGDCILNWSQVNAS